MMFRKCAKKLLATLLAMLLMACNESHLLENLTQQQANQVLAVLQQYDIAAQKQGGGKGGYTITINRAEATAALSIINLYQLPWSGDVQIGQAFPESALVASPNAEQARVISLQEQRLEQSLRIISQVVNAKVHISYPLFSNDAANRFTSDHVGVIITHKGNIDESVFISQVKSLIKNSLSNIRYENISVVLFAVPAIQYVPPTKVRSVDFTVWQGALILALLMVLMTGIYFIAKMMRRSTPNDAVTPMTHEKEPPA
ncbi:type III secretion system inner membrane ring lipoprotein SctJ [Candidatus Symbiopectobacterium sp. NZEC127]|uniref:type III secretion system inner membrane ring lipoprotein SctJ n=2 Tax=unclassified Symbiopectobacterium TaxID=2794573 RepID=UPI0039B62A03